jgi:hypothetical protein
MGGRPSSAHLCSISVRVPKVDGLLKAAEQSKRPVKAIEYDGKRLRIEYFDSREATVAAPAVAVPVAAPVAATVAARVEYVPGTMFPADDSPLNPLDLVLTPPTIYPVAESN